MDQLFENHRESPSFGTGVFDQGLGLANAILNNERGPHRLARARGQGWRGIEPVGDGRMAAVLDAAPPEVPRQQGKGRGRRNRVRSSAGLGIASRPATRRRGP